MNEGENAGKNAEQRTPPRARCKFTVDSVKRTAYGDELRLETQYDETVAEDVAFCDATPSGHMEVWINNPALVGRFQPGDEYYVDLVPIGKKG